MALTFYYDLVSQPCRAVYLLLKMTAIPFQGKQVSLMRRENMNETFLKNESLFKKVPVIDDSGFILTESVPIMMYVCHKYKKHDWYPNDLKQKARVDEYNHWQHINVRPTGSMLFRTKMVTPRELNKPPIPSLLEKWHAKWQESTADLENVWLTRSSYLAGEHLTIADLLGICEMMQPSAGGYDLDRQKFPRVYDWMERVKEATQPHFHDAHIVINRMREGEKSTI